MKKQQGFTLIELLVVITIMGVIAAIGVSSYKIANQKARDSRRLADVQQLRSALEMYRSDFGEYPVQSTLTGLLSAAVSPACNSGATFKNCYLGGQEVESPKGNNYTYVSADGSTYTIGYTTEVNPTPMVFRNP